MIDWSLSLIDQTSSSEHRWVDLPPPSDPGLSSCHRHGSSFQLPPFLSGILQTCCRPDLGLEHRDSVWGSNKVSIRIFLCKKTFDVDSVILVSLSCVCLHWSSCISVDPGSVWSESLKTSTSSVLAGLCFTFWTEVWIAVWILVFLIRAILTSGLLTWILTTGPDPIQAVVVVLDFENLQRDSRFKKGFLIPEETCFVTRSSKVKKKNQKQKRSKQK